MQTDQAGRQAAAAPGASAATRATAKVGLILFGLTLAAYLLEYATNLVLARSLPAERYGDLTLALRILGIAASLALVGTATSSKRFLAQYLKRRDDRSAGAFIRWNMRFVRWPFAACLAISIALAWAVTHMHLTGVKHVESYHLAVLMLGLAPVLAAMLLLSSYLQCSEHNLAAYLPANIFRHILFLFGWWVVLAVIGAQPTNLLLVTIALLVILAILTMQFVYVRGRVPSLVEAWRSRNAAPEDGQTTIWGKSSRRLTATSVVFLIIVSLDLIVLEVVARDEAVIGYYGAVLAMVAIMPRLPEGPLRPIVPRMSGLVGSAAGRRELQGLINGAMKINLVTGLAAWAILVVFGRTLLAHFGPGFEQAYPALVLVGSAAAITMLVQPAPLLLAYAGREHHLMQVTALEFAVLLAAAIPLGVLYGMTGVAAATLLASAVKAVLATVLARTLGLRPLGAI